MDSATKDVSSVSDVVIRDGDWHSLAAHRVQACSRSARTNFDGRPTLAYNR